jgi:2-amino-4-hydroxy-6-hydroxymethyldihydropteridine diphosphokinase
MITGAGESSTMSATAYIALGGNLGDRRATFAGAILDLQRDWPVQQSACSCLYETEPVGGPPGQPDFLNAVIRVSTALNPSDLLAAMREIERCRGRSRSEPMGPRTLDLDLLLHGDRIVSQPDLQIPHPRLHERLFVLRPLCDIAPRLVHPVLGRTVAELLAGLQSQGDGLRQVAGIEWASPQTSGSSSTSPANAPS